MLVGAIRLRRVLTELATNELAAADRPPTGSVRAAMADRLRRWPTLADKAPSSAGEAPSSAPSSAAGATVRRQPHVIHHWTGVTCGGGQRWLTAEIELGIASSRLGSCQRFIVADDDDHPRVQGGVGRMFLQSGRVSRARMHRRRADQIRFMRNGI